tara:strand:- start:48486 stop:48836 length:351 start_codon:yes stop_codon:yes gene_type:complete
LDRLADTFYGTGDRWPTADSEVSIGWNVREPYPIGHLHGLYHPCAADQRLRPLLLWGSVIGTWVEGPYPTECLLYGHVPHRHHTEHQTKPEQDFGQTYYVVPGEAEKLWNRVGINS